MPHRDHYEGAIEVAGHTLKYRAYCLPDGVINVGRITVEQKEKNRALRHDERAILMALLHRSEAPQFLKNTLNTAYIADLPDGRMGSIHFLHESPRIYGRTLVEACFLDQDGVPVSLSLSVDQHGKLFELDIWKVDFAPLCRYPLPAELSSQEPTFNAPRIEVERSSRQQTKIL